MTRSIDIILDRLAGSEDHEIAAAGNGGSHREAPGFHIVTQAPSRQVDLDSVRIVDLDPIRIVAVSIREHVTVRRHELRDDGFSLERGEDGPCECYGKTKGHLGAAIKLKSEGMRCKPTL